MPPYWDLASLVANTAVFEGASQPMVADEARGLDGVRDEPEAFWWTLRAHVAAIRSTKGGARIAWTGRLGVRMAPMGAVADISPRLDTEPVGCARIS